MFSVQTVIQSHFGNLIVNRCSWVGRGGLWNPDNWISCLSLCYLICRMNNMPSYDRGCEDYGNLSTEPVVPKI